MTERAKEPGQIAYEASCPPTSWADCSRTGRDIWASIEAIVRASALEEAAKEVEAFEPLGPPDAEYERKDPLDYERAMSVYARTANIASAIRALIPRPADGGDAG